MITSLGNYFTVILGIFGFAKCIYGKARAIVGRRIEFIFIPLRKHAYSNILKTSSPKNEIFQIKNSDIFHVSAQNIDCGYSLEPPRRGSSNEYSQSIFEQK